jgi:SAM-dependent methyltransferase
VRDERQGGPEAGERAAPEALGALVSKEFWNERHGRVSLRSVAPQPKKYYLDFELDRIFRRWLGPGRGRRLLEAGCGSSLWLPYFARRLGWEVAGLDYSDTGLALSREILRRNGVQARLRKADLRDGAGQDRESFDAVFSLGLIEHFEHPENVLARLKDFVRPGGLLLTWIPNTAGIIPRLNPLLDRHYRGFYSRLDLPRLCAHHCALGFDILQSSYVQFLDLNFLSLAFLPGALQRGFDLAFRGFGLSLMALGKAVSGPVQSRRLCAGIVVVARRRM